MKVTKEVTFDSAHMLSNYRGKCSNLHGHTYKLQVTVIGRVQTEGNEQGMVIDFNSLKTALDDVTNRFDHALIFSGAEYRNEAEDALLIWADKFGMNFIILDGKSTSETIASEILYLVQTSLPGADSVSVKLWETPTSFAEV